MRRRPACSRCAKPEVLRRRGCPRAPAIAPGAGDDPQPHASLPPGRGRAAAAADAIARIVHDARMISSFPPIAARDARVLILGSMPGRASLAAGQYYAHPRNAFWPVMAALFGLDPDAAYEHRCRALCRSGVAVWDVLRACVREGSLDSAIDPRSMQANDFAAFFAAHPRIGAVFFNGATAERVYRRHVLPTLRRPAAQLPLTRLPSTSPAYASLTVAEKSAAWASAMSRHRALGDDA